MKKLVSVTTAEQESECSFCKEPVKLGDKIYEAIGRPLVCHFSCGPDAKKKSAKDRKAKANAQYKAGLKKHNAKVRQDVKYYSAIKGVPTGQPLRNGHARVIAH